MFPEMMTVGRGCEGGMPLLITLMPGGAPPAPTALP